jgi:hypothetical protein
MVSPGTAPQRCSAPWQVKEHLCTLIVHPKDTESKTAKEEWRENVES